METKYIREFAVLAAIGSYSSAAKALFISQSSLFKHVKALETDLGVPLFERIGKHIVLSEYGQLFLPYAKKFVETEDSCLSEIDASRILSSSVIYIGTQYRITHLVALFRKLDRRYTLRVIEHGSLNTFFNDGCELAFIRDFTDTSGKYESLHFISDRMAVVLPKDHPLAAQSSLSPADLRDEDFICLSTDSHDSTSGVDMLRRILNFTPRVVMSSSLGSESVRLVNAGIGITVICKNTVIDDLPDGVVLCDLEGSEVFDVSLVWQRGENLSAGAKAFIDFLRRYIDEREKS